MFSRKIFNIPTNGTFLWSALNDHTELPEIIIHAGRLPKAFDGFEQKLHELFGSDQDEEDEIQDVGDIDLDEKRHEFGADEILNDIIYSILGFRYDEGLADNNTFEIMTPPPKQPFWRSLLGG